MPGTANSGGRNKKSTQAHVLRGTFRSDRHGAVDDTPAPPAGVPVPPKKLSKEAKGEWDRMVASLTTNNTIATVDHHALYQCVELFAETEAVKSDWTRLRQLSNELKKQSRRLDGQELIDAIREVIKLEFLLDKQTTKLRQGHMALRQYYVEFGLTPSARARVKVNGSGTPKQSKFDKFMAAKHA